MFEKIGAAEINGRTLNICTATYGNGRIAIQTFTQYGEPYSRVSVNIPDAKNIGQSEFAFDANNNSWDAAHYMDSGLFKDTGKFAHSGFCRYPIWALIA
jgi:hypothetical protein